MSHAVHGLPPRRPGECAVNRLVLRVSNMTVPVGVVATGFELVCIEHSAFEAFVSSC